MHQVGAKQTYTYILLMHIQDTDTQFIQNRV
jgi:hypothetical protein